MNLYKLHTIPELLTHYTRRLRIPAVAYDAIITPNDEYLEPHEFDIALEAIRKVPGYALDYAIEVLDGRWPEAEEVIATEAYSALMYAGMILGGRFKLAEETIKKDPISAARYATSILVHKWPEAEPHIKQDVGAWNLYTQAFK